MTDGSKKESSAIEESVGTIFGVCRETRSLQRMWTFGLRRVLFENPVEILHVQQLAVFKQDLCRIALTVR